MGDIFDHSTTSFSTDEYICGLAEQYNPDQTSFTDRSRYPIWGTVRGHTATEFPAQRSGRSQRRREPVRCRAGSRWSESDEEHQGTCAQ